MKLATNHSAAARGLLAALLFGAAQLAYAHAHPTHQAPAADATVALTQDSVALDFYDALEPAFSSIQVTDAHGQSVTAAPAAVDPRDTKHMSVALKPLAPGVYTVKWTAVAADTHRTQGHYSFTAK